MRQFNGFPMRMQFTAIPNVFFSSLLPQINDMAELKTTLHIFFLLYRKRGYPRFITAGELMNDAGLMKSLGSGERIPAELLRDGLEKAVKRGSVLHLALDRDGASEDVYFLNDEAGRRAIAKIDSGELQLSGLKFKKEGYVATEPTPDLFTLYEQNIGLLTPMVAEELRAAQKDYPETWLTDAIKEAAALNKRSWRYIERILERWLAEGKGDGTYRRDFEKTDPNKYIKGKYGRAVKR